MSELVTKEQAKRNVENADFIINRIEMVEDRLQVFRQQMNGLLVDLSLLVDTLHEIKADLNKDR